MVQHMIIISMWQYGTEAVAQRCSVKKVFLEISQNSQEDTCARVPFLIKKETVAQAFSCKFCKISLNTFSYRRPPVATSNGGIALWKYKYSFLHVMLIQIRKKGRFQGWVWFNMSNFNLELNMPLKESKNIKS